MQTAKSTFIGRLLEVLGTRKRHVWGVALGFTNNRVHRLFVESESLPNTEELALIGEAENLNLNWLVYGIGPKYLVNTFRGFAEFNAAVQDVLQEDWANIYIIVCKSRCALLTSRTKNLQYKNRDVDIRQIRCLIGPGSANLQSIVAHGVEFPSIQFDELERGDIGTYFLFGDSRTEGFLEGLGKHDVQNLIGNMPLAVPHDDIDLARLMSCYNKIQSLMKNTGQQVNDEKLSELVWVMYQTEMMDKNIKTKN